MLSARFFRVLGRLTSGQPTVSVPLRDEEGELIRSEGGKLERWGRWGATLFGEEGRASGSTVGVEQPHEWKATGSQQSEGAGSDAAAGLEPGQESERVPDVQERGRGEV
eukprot:53288-Eustigmatos_ZCMA.PRE.1